MIQIRSEPDGSIVLSSTLMGRYLIYVGYSTLPLIVFLSPLNDFVKVAVALYTAVSFIVYALYSVMITVKTHHSSSRLYSARTEGLIYTILNFVPNIFIFCVQLLAVSFTRVLRVLGLKSQRLDTAVLTYALTSLLKMTCLTSSTFITTDDDSSTHLKAYMGLLGVTLVQYRLIMNMDTQFFGSSSGRVSMGEGFKSFIDAPGKNQKYETEKMRFRRSVLFVLTLFLSTIFNLNVFQAYSGIPQTESLLRAFIPKLLIITDFEFLKTLCLEIRFVKLSVINDTETYYHKV